MPNRDAIKRRRRCRRDDSDRFPQGDDAVNKVQPVVRAKQRFTSNVIPPIFVMADLVCLLLSAPIALVAYSVFFGERANFSVHFAAALMAGIAFFLIRSSRDAYAHPFSQIEKADKVVAIDYFVASLLSSAIIWQFGLVDLFSRGLMLLYVGSALTTLFFSRFALRAVVGRLARSGRIGQRVALYGADPLTVERAYRILKLQALPQLQLIGVADERGEPSDLPSLPFIGGFAELLERARAGDIDQVLIALPDINRERLDQILEELSSVSVDVSMIPREVLALWPSYEVGFLGSVPILTFWQRPFRDINVILKTAEDWVIAGLAVLFLAPLLLLTAAIIKLTSRGPVFFVQPRFGFNNEEIYVYKFRSMYIDQEDRLGAERTRRNDARVTPFGRFIRKFSIDELPQLLNVLRGDMSIVGPRPHATHMKVGDLYYFDAVKGYAARHRVKPGITGLAQVRGLRGEISSIERAKRRVDLDKQYIETWSLMLDLRIILETAFKVVIDKNAY